MITSKKVTGTAVPMPMGIALGVTVSLIFTAVSAALLTWLALQGKISESSVGYYAMGILMLASIFGPMLSAAKIKRRRMVVCCITGAAYYAVLLLCTAVLFGGQYQGVGVSTAMIFGGSIGTGLLGIRKSGGKGNGYKKYRNR